MNKVRNRIEELDILKALGIICVVAGHSDPPFRTFIYLFHMAVFFMASGFFYKESSSDSIKTVLKNVLTKLKELWMPFAVWNTIFILLHNTFIRINVYTDNPDIKNFVYGKFIGTTQYYSDSEILPKILRSIFNFNETEQMAGAFWFLKVLFAISVFYCLFNYILKKIIPGHVLAAQAVISAVLLSLGFWCHLNGVSFNGLLYNIELAASFYCLYYIGHVLSMYRNKYSEWGWRAYLPILAGSFFALLLLNKAGTIELAANSYENPLFLIAASCLGWAFLYSLSFFLKQIDILKTILTYIGRNTLAVMILHFLAMKIVAAVYVSVHSIPAICIAAFPNLYGYERFWWAAYTFVGVSVPVLLSIAYKSAKGKTAQWLNHKRKIKTLNV